MITNPTLHQAGVVAYQVVDGKVRVLLMTSRNTGRRIIPKGNIGAEQQKDEAHEEAGTEGPSPAQFHSGFTSISKFWHREKSVLRQSRFTCSGLPNSSGNGRKSASGDGHGCPEKGDQAGPRAGVVPVLRRLPEFEADLAEPLRKIPSGSRNGEVSRQVRMRAASSSSTC
jgi:hypothetical protein